MKLKLSINQRKLRYGSYSVAVILIFLALVIGLNLVVNALPASADMTPNRLFSTSERTAEVLSELDQEVIIYALFDEVQFRDNYVMIEKLLSDYAKNSYITIRYIDAYKNPGAIRNIDPDNFYKLQPSNFLFVSGDKKRKVTLNDFNTTRSNPFTGQTYTELAIEETVTGTIIFVTAKDTPVIYFVQGHGEIELSTVSVLNEYMTRNNFDIRTLNTLTAENIPADADMIVFLSPQRDITIEERVKLQDFFDDTAEKHKALMVLLDPSETGVDFAQINTLLEKYNLRFNNDFVMENNSDYHIPGYQFFILPMYNAGNYRVYTPYSRSVEILQNFRDFIEEDGILQTSQSAVSMNVVTNEEVTGQKNIAARVDYKGGYYPTRVFAIGNTAFLYNQVVNNYTDNMEFILDQIRWTLSFEGSSIYIPAKAAVDTTIRISQRQATTISLALIILIPLIMFGAGTIIYVRRKNL